MRSRRGARAIVRVSGPFVGYLAVVVWLTWPLARAASTSLPSTRYSALHDTLYSAWVLAWESHALVTAPAHFADANIYHPTTGALFYGPAALGALPLFAPVFLATGNAALATNVMLVFGLALTATAMHVILRRWTGSELAGLVGASTLLANPWLVRDFVPIVPHWAALGLLPLVAFTAAVPFPSTRAALRLLPLVVLQCLTDLVYVAPAVLAPLGALIILRLLRPATRAAALRLAAVLVLGGLALAPVYRGYLGVRAANPALERQTTWTIAEADFAAPLPARFLDGQFPFVVRPVTIVLVGVGALAALRRRRKGSAPPAPGGWAHGALWSVVGAVVSLPPTVTVAGGVYRTPMGLLDLWLHLYRTLRVPSRVGVAGLLGLGILSGVAYGEIVALVGTRLRTARAARLVRAGVAVVLVGLVFQANGVVPAGLPLQTPPDVPAAFAPVLRSSRGPLLELPAGPDGLAGNAHAAAMYRSTAHWRPLLNGYASYWPAGFAERMAAAARLPDADALDGLVASTGLSLIWLHTRGLTREQLAAWTPPPRGLTVVARDGTDVLFAVLPTTPAARSLD